MSKCTAKQALDAFEYWDGYYEKATSAYSTTRDKSAFDKNKGSGNYTYPGHVCGVNGQPWCAAAVSNAILEACGGAKDDAKAVMWGVWPYVACNQLWDAAPANMKGRRGAWTPKPGDVIIFTDDGVTRSHTGTVYAVDDKYVYTREGNSGNMCRKRSYLLTSTYIYGYVRPDYAEGETPQETGEKYGAAVSVTLHTLSKGTSGPEVKTLQRLLNAAVNAKLAVDGDFGKMTKTAVLVFQELCGLAQDGVVGAKTWAELLG